MLHYKVLFKFWVPPLGTSPTTSIGLLFQGTPPPLTTTFCHLSKPSLAVTLFTLQLLASSPMLLPLHSVTFFTIIPNLTEFLNSKALPCQSFSRTYFQDVVGAHFAASFWVTFCFGWMGEGQTWVTTKYKHSSQYRTQNMCQKDTSMGTVLDCHTKQWINGSLPWSN